MTSLIRSFRDWALIIQNHGIRCTLEYSYFYFAQYDSGFIDDLPKKG